MLKQVCDAVSTISGAAQAAGAAAVHPYESAGELAAALNDFDVRSSHVVLLPVITVIILIQIKSSICLKCR